MANQSGIDMVSSYLPSSESTRLCHLDSLSEYLRDKTDVVFVVEGAELPCHILILAQLSQVFCEMAEFAGDQRNHSAP